MPNNSIRKNNISLKDYNFQRDVENRLLMAEFTVQDVLVLKEILDHSLTIPLHILCEDLEISAQELERSLEKLSKTKLFRIQNSVIHVDKEMRRYYETQMDKFDDDFEPNMEYIQGLLNKVPIHQLISWYSFPQTTNNIFLAIVENYFRIPKNYEDYLRDLKFDEKILTNIMNDVCLSPDYKIPASEIMQKYSLTREKFEEFMLHLEYNFACYLGYVRKDNVWEEIVTLVHEWSNMLRLKRSRIPNPIEKSSEINKVFQDEVGFLKELAKLLEKSLSEEGVKVNLKTLYAEEIVQLLTELELATFNKGVLRGHPEAEEWLIQPLFDQAMSIYRCSSYLLQNRFENYSEKDRREVERHLKSFMKSGWILVDDFINSMTGSIGQQIGISLQNKGKKWEYVFPQYSEDDKRYIQSVLLQPLFYSGMISLGHYNDKLCFSVTAFGRVILG